MNSSSWLDGIYNIEIFASDSHTKNAINKYDIDKKNSEIVFNTDEGNIVIELDTENMIINNVFIDHILFI